MGPMVRGSDNGFSKEHRHLLTTHNLFGTVVDNTAWDVYAIVTEWGPDGRVEEEVKKHWGYGISQDSKDTDFSKDMDRIFLNLHVIANNGPNSIGGGGQPRAPLAPPFQEEEDRGSGGLSLVALLLSVLSSGVW